jgi:PncC family amidohydrolase
VKGLVDRVSERLRARRLVLGLAESCTGGALAAAVTDRPGASGILSAGLVTYSDDAKVRLLGVRPETLAAAGAVSEAVVREMLTGALRATGADAALAVTGIAGPAGGTPAKPVGTVWIAAAVGDREAVEAHYFPGSRAQVRARSVMAALALLDRLLEDPA